MSKSGDAPDALRMSDENGDERKADRPPGSTTRILMIEDNHLDVRIISEILKGVQHEAYNVQSAETLAAGITFLEHNEVDAIMLDLSLPDSRGVDTVRVLRKRFVHLPIIVFTGTGDRDTGLEAVRTGAQDYLVKGMIDPETLVRVLQYAIERKKTERQILTLAYFDNLTQLPNRTLFKERLSYGLELAKRYNRMCALLFLDLDNFKRVNDSLGHRVGDLLLVEVAGRIKVSIRRSDLVDRDVADLEEGDSVARLGGDEFTIFLTEIKQPEDASKVATNLANALSKPFILENNEIFVSASIGIALYPTDGDDMESLLKHSDSAMYSAKSRGKSTFHYYENSMNTIADKRLDLENRLRKTVRDKGFTLFYQPIMSAGSRAIIGMEALLRWQLPEGNFVSPVDFIPAAEESNLIVPIGEEVIEMACGQLARWRDQGLAAPPMSVNISVRQLEITSVADMISRNLTLFNLKAPMLECEVTESIFIRDFDAIIRELRKIIEMGIPIALDDFGTGFSSFSYLNTIPIHVLKIDRSFIKDLPGDRKNASIVSGVLDIGRNLGLRTVAEGVERLDQFEFLRSHLCTAIQGYLLSPPVPEDRMTAILKREQDGRGIGAEIFPPAAGSP
jgi:diguanylate cyclase (GGDEF)-like protein